jgi:glucokinase
MGDLEKIAKLQKDLIAHFMEREKLSRRICGVLGPNTGLGVSKNDSFAYERLAQLNDELERQAFEQACR